jgi:peptidyl-prolyl cis-trans isomerase SurA
MLSRFLLSIALVIPAHAVIIDRIAVVVDRAPILDSEIARDIRLTAFLNQEQPDSSEASRKKAASRLIDQQMIRRQVRLGGYPVASQAETNQFLAQIRRDRFPADAQFKQALARYDITEDELRDRLSWELTVLRFIDTMFRPQVVVSDQEVQQYYAAHRAQFDSRPLDAVRSAIVETVTGEKVNTLLNEWLEQGRKSTRIEYLEKPLE